MLEYVRLDYLRKMSFTYIPNINIRNHKDTNYL